MGILHALRTWGEMIRFSHSIFALPFALMATFLAGRSMPHGRPAAGQLGLIILCMVAARSFAMTFNRLADARIDARNPRTADRPLPSGRITSAQALVFLLAAGAFFLLGCTGFWWGYGNPWPIALALPTLVLIAVYSFAKRFTSGAHFFLGVAIGFAPPAAWIAVHPATLGLPALWLGLAVLFWIAGFDIIYACQDVAVDRHDGLFSLPARWGVAASLWVSRFCHLMTIIALIALGASAGLGWLYAVAVALTTLLLTVEQAVVRPNDLSRVNLAFFTLNGCVSLLLGLATIADILLR